MQYKIFIEIFFFFFFLSNTIFVIFLSDGSLNAATFYDTFFMMYLKTGVIVFGGNHACVSVRVACLEHLLNQLVDS